MNRISAITVKVVTFSKSRFKFLLPMSSSSGKSVWRLFQPAYGLDTLLTIPLSRLTHSSIILYVGDIGNTVMGKLDKISASSSFHFTLTNPAHPRSKPFFFLSFKIYSPPPFSSKSLMIVTLHECSITFCARDYTMMSKASSLI